MLCYWFTSNAFSLVQVLFLKIPAVREYFKIEQMVVHPQSVLPKKKGFLQGFKDCKLFGFNIHIPVECDGTTDILQITSSVG